MKMLNHPYFVDRNICMCLFMVNFDLAREAIRSDIVELGSELGEEHLHNKKQIIYGVIYCFTLRLDCVSRIKIMLFRESNDGTDFKNDF